MRHQKLRGQLGLKASHREALLRNLLLSLLKHERIQTTIARAKELKRYADPIIELGKNKGVEQIRKIRKSVHDKEALKKLFDIYGPRFKNRSGGYTRIYKIGVRHGDCAEMGLIEILPEPGKENEPRIIRTKHKHAEGEHEGGKKKREHKGEPEKVKRESLRAEQEAKAARDSKQIVHSHMGKTEKGTSRTKTSKKGLS